MSTLTRSEAAARPRASVAPFVLAAVALVGLTALLIAVGRGDTHALDVAVRDRMRPGDVWGPHQIWANRVVMLLHPVLLGLWLVAVSAQVGWARGRGSLRPVGFVLGCYVGALLLAESAKLVLRRADPHGDLSSLGSFPSGHTVATVTAAGLTLLAWQVVVPRWQWLLVGASGLVIGGALLIDATHWFTDVVGGGLVSVAALALASHLAPRVLPTR